VQQRFDTILRVSQAIVDRQRAFFSHGAVAMRPLVLREIAEELGLHESTVSRVTTQKYMLTPRGTYELKYFFGSHVATDTGGAASATAIRALIRQLIGAEDMLEATARHAGQIVLGEQGILNLWLQRQGVAPCSLLPEYNVFRHREGAAGARLVHAVGHRKPWMDFGDAQWNADYAHWLALGGTPCPVWKTVRFMATRRPHPLRERRELLPRAREILRFLSRRRVLARAARRGRGSASG